MQRAKPKKKTARHDVPPSFFSLFLGVLLGVGASEEMLMLSFLESRCWGAATDNSDERNNEFWEGEDQK